MNSAALKAVREMATRSTGYSHTLVFTRRFTSGALDGLTQEDRIGFCSAADCDEWVSSVNRHNANGKVNYRVESWRIQAA